MIANKWYNIAKTNTIGTYCIVNISFGSSNVVFSASVNYGVYSLNIDSCTIEDDYLLSVRLRQSGSSWYIDLYSNKDIEPIVDIIGGQYWESLNTSAGAGTIVAIINDISEDFNTQPGGGGTIPSEPCPIGLDVYGQAIVKDNRALVGKKSKFDTVIIPAETPAMLSEGEWALYLNMNGIGAEVPDSDGDTPGSGGGEGIFDTDKLWEELTQANPLRVIDESHIPTLGVNKIKDLSLQLDKYLLKAGGEITGNLSVLGKLMPRTLIVSSQVPENVADGEWSFYLNESGIGGEVPEQGEGGSSGGGNTGGGENEVFDIDALWEELGLPNSSRLIDESHIPLLGISKINGLENKLSEFLLKAGGTITGDLTVKGRFIPNTFIVPQTANQNIENGEFALYLDEDGVGAELPTGGNLDEDKLWALLASVNDKHVIDSSHIPSLEISKVNNLQTLLNGKADASALNNFLSLEGGTMKGNIKLLPGSSFISKSNDDTAIFGYTASEVLVGANNSALSLRSNGIATIDNNQIIHAGNISSQSVANAHNLRHPNGTLGATVASNGWVGIITENPEYPLDILGDTRVQGKIKASTLLVPTYSPNDLSSGEWALYLDINGVGGEGVGGSGTGSFDPLALWAELESKDPNKIIDATHIPLLEISKINGLRGLLNNKLESSDLNGYAKESWVTGQGYALDSDVKNTYATKFDLTNTNNNITTLQGYFTNGSANNALKLGGILASNFWHTGNSGSTAYNWSAKKLVSKTLVVPTAQPTDLTSSEWGIYLNESGVGASTPNGGDNINEEQLWAILENESNNIIHQSHIPTIEISGVNRLQSVLNGKVDNSALSNYLPLSGGTIKNGNAESPLRVDSNASQTYLTIANNSNSKSAFGWIGTQGTFIYSFASNRYLGIKDDGTPHYQGNTLWHTGNFNPADYLPKNGGKLTGDITLVANHFIRIKPYSATSNGGGWANKGLEFVNENDTTLGAIGAYGNNNSLGYIYIGTQQYNGLNLRIGTNELSWGDNAILHSGNYSDYALPLSGGTIESTNLPLQINRLSGSISSIGYNLNGIQKGILGFDADGNFVVSPNRTTNSTYYNVIHTGNIGSYNAGSATKLQDNTAYTAWGQTFFENGKPKNVDGDFTLYKNSSNNAEGWARGIVVRNSSDAILCRFGFLGAGETLTYAFIGNTYSSPYISFISNGNVLIGKTADNGYKLQVNGTLKPNGLIIPTSAPTDLKAGDHALYLGSVGEGAELPSGVGGLDVAELWAELGKVDDSKQINVSHIPTIEIARVSGLQTILNNKADTSALSSYLLKSGGTISGALTLQNSIVVSSGADRKIVLNNADTKSKYQFISFMQEELEYGKLGTAGTDDLRWNNNIVLHSGNYSSYALPLSGGTIESTNLPLQINRLSGSISSIGYNLNGIQKGILGFDADGNFVVSPNRTTNSTYYNVIHTGNIGSQSVSYANSAGNADSLTFTEGLSNVTRPILVGASESGKVYYSSAITINYALQELTAPKFVGALIGNASSATRLQTARTIWGQNFDGSANIPYTATPNMTFIHFNKNASTAIGYVGKVGSADHLYFGGYDGVPVTLFSNGITSNNLTVATTGNVLIGTTTDRGYKLDVNGTFNAGASTIASLAVSGNLEIGTTDNCYIALKRNSLNYFHATEANGYIGFVTNAKGSSRASCDLLIQNALVCAGITEYTDLGSTTYRWKGINAKTLNLSSDAKISGEMDANALVIPTAPPTNPQAGKHYLYLA